MQLQLISFNGELMEEERAEDNVRMMLWRQFSKALEDNTSALRSLDSKVDGIDLKMARMEEANLKAAVEKLTSRVQLLESARDQQTGAIHLVEWLGKYAPWLLAGVAAFAAGLGWKGKLHL